MAVARLGRFCRPGVRCCLFRNFSTSKNLGKERVFVVGVGMTKFSKPLGVKGPSFIELGKEAVHEALKDAGVPYIAVEGAHVGYVFGPSTKGQSVVYQAGLTGIPITNVNNNCATGASALFASRNMIAGGLARCTLAVGVEKMQKGSLTLDVDDVNPIEDHITQLVKECGHHGDAPIAPWMFAVAGQQHMKKYGTTIEQFAKIAVKNHRHSINNPNAQFTQEYSLSDVLESKEIFSPLTKLQCSPTSDGAAAVILANQEFVKDHGLQDNAVEIAGISLATDVPSSFDNPINVVGSAMTVRAARQAYREAGIAVKEAQVVELHDCFSVNELLTYEALGMCDEGDGGALVDRGDVTYGGRWVVNPSGGLISKGHPLGATGVAQCIELCWQLRGLAGERQVNPATVAVQHNIGLGGASAVAVYKKY